MLHGHFPTFIGSQIEPVVETVIPPRLNLWVGLEEAASPIGWMLAGCCLAACLLAAGWLAAGSLANQSINVN